MTTGAAAFLDRYEAQLGQLPGDSALRAAAAAAFKAAGLPGGTQQRRIEAWKYTSLRPLAETSFRTDATPRHEAETILAGLTSPSPPSSPAAQSSSPATQTSSPATQTSWPATQTSSPATQTSSPATQTSSPGTQSSSPATQSSWPGLSGPPPQAPASTGGSDEPRHDAGRQVSEKGSDTTRIVFVDGALRPDLSTPPATGFARFAEQPDFGTLSWPDREPMVALNTMLATDGATLHVPAGQNAGTIQLISIAASDADFHPRHTIRLEQNASLTILEISAGQGTYLLNTVAEIHLAPGAHLTHIRLQDESPNAFHISTTYADIDTSATYDSFTLNLGARLSRTEARVQLTGQGATAHLNAAQILTGTQHADFTTVVSHTAPSCTSRQIVKNVLAGRSKGVFQGRIEVARLAQKTDGYQMNQALLLSPNAEIDSKPELEIFADDVKCSHGATVGELDAEQLFYLRSRGVPDAEARSILVRAFLAETLDAVTNETIRTHLEAAVESWWERQTP